MGLMLAFTHGGSLALSRHIPCGPLHRRIPAVRVTLGLLYRNGRWINIAMLPNKLLKPLSQREVGGNRK
jgi:hypothetical protein